MKDKGCGQYLNELLWGVFNPDDILFDILPEKFLIKVTHGSIFNIICKDKESLKRNRTTKLIKKWLKTKFIPCYGEWFYGLEKSKIIVEKYLEPDGERLFDYKIFCFNLVA